jgi:hypothetical protein
MFTTCFVRQFFRFAQSRPAQDTEQCVIDGWAKSFSEGGGAFAISSRPTWRIPTFQVRKGGSMKTHRPQFSRRDLLKAAGSTLAVPLFLKNAFGAETPAAPPSLVLLQTTNGTHQSAFWPAAVRSTRSSAPTAFGSGPGPKATLIKGINYKAIGKSERQRARQRLSRALLGVRQHRGPRRIVRRRYLARPTNRNEVKFPNGQLKSIHCGVHAVILQGDQRRSHLV